MAIPKHLFSTDGTANGHAVVTHERWVHRSELCIGMYVYELDKPWEQTNFMFQGFYINSPAMLAAVRAQCQHARVMTTKIGDRTVRSNRPLSDRKVRDFNEFGT